MAKPERVPWGRLGELGEKLKSRFYADKVNGEAREVSWVRRKEESDSVPGTFLEVSPRRKLKNNISLPSSDSVPGTLLEVSPRRKLKNNISLPSVI